ncbi:MAG: hypothetical protein R3B40_25780 [Polyangiales bacterium]
MSPRASALPQHGILDNASVSLHMPATLEKVLQDALTLGHGEITVHVGREQDRIFLAGGAIAWVVSAGAPTSLARVMTSRGLALRPALQQVWKQCRETGRNFAEALVEDGVVERVAMRDALLEHNARQLRALVERAAQGQVVFHSVQRAYASELCFSLHELSAEVARLEELAQTGTRLRAPEHGSETSALTTSGIVPPTNPWSQVPMSTIASSLEQIMTLDGALAAALVDYESGMTLGTTGGGAGFDIELAASGNTSVVKAKTRVMKDLGLPGVIEDMLITLETQYHIIRPLTRHPSLFIYVAIDKQRGNLGLARHKLRAVEEGLTL